MTSEEQQPEEQQQKEQPVEAQPVEERPAGNFAAEARKMKTKLQGRFGWLPLIVMSLMSAVLAGGGVFLFLQRQPLGHEEAAPLVVTKKQWQCPMHPTIVQDHPGDCPICGMKLVKMEQAAPNASINAKPEPMLEATAAGMSTIDIDPQQQQLIGLVTAEVKTGKVGGVVRTTGRVAVDETRVEHANVKISGFAEHVYVDYVGRWVKKGAPLFTFYSPDLLSAEEEYLLALKTASVFSKAGGASSENGKALVDSARRRLSLWDVSEAEIRRIEETGRPMRTLTVYSPATGVVTKKEVVDGMKLDAGAMPYEIVDLSSVWVLADVYESEIRFIKRGISAALTLTAFPSRTFEGKVIFIDPFLDPETRTVKVRLAFRNPDGDLKPEMFGEVVLKTASHDGLIVPADAIIDSGTSKTVFIATGDGKFQPRTVEIGTSDGSAVEVTKGLTAGERLVIRANFLIDSESRLRASLSDSAESKSAKPESARVLPAAGGEGLNP